MIDGPASDDARSTGADPGAGDSGDGDRLPGDPAPLGPDVPRDLSADELGEAIVQLHVAEMAVHARLLALVGRFSELEGFRADGAPSLEAWLTFRLGVARATARAWARCGVALGELPAIAAQAAEGRLSHDQLAPLCALATPEDDAELARLAPGWTPAELQGALCARRAAEPRVERDEYGKIERVRVSARTGEGIDLLREALKDSARPVLRPDPRETHAGRAKPPVSASELGLELGNG